MIAKIEEIRELLGRGRADPEDVRPEFERLAASGQWPTREVAATALVEISKRQPEAVRPVLEMLRSDPDSCVKKSVANVLRNASVKHAEFVLGICRRWVRPANQHTAWIVKNGLRKLADSRPHEVATILQALDGAG